MTSARREPKIRSLSRYQYIQLITYSLLYTASLLQSSLTCNQLSKLDLIPLLLKLLTIRTIVHSNLVWIYLLIIRGALVIGDQLLVIRAGPKYPSLLRSVRHQRRCSLTENSPLFPGRSMPRRCRTSETKPTEKRHNLPGRG